MDMDAMEEGLQSCVKIDRGHTDPGWVLLHGIQV